MTELDWTIHNRMELARALYAAGITDVMDRLPWYKRLREETTKQGHARGLEAVIKEINGRTTDTPEN